MTFLGLSYFATLSIHCRPADRLAMRSGWDSDTDNDLVDDFIAIITSMASRTYERWLA